MSTLSRPSTWTIEEDVVAMWRSGRRCAATVHEGVSDPVVRANLDELIGLRPPQVALVHGRDPMDVVEEPERNVDSLRIRIPAQDLCELLPTDSCMSGCREEGGHQTRETEALHAFTSPAGRPIAASANARGTAHAAAPCP